MQFSFSINTYVVSESFSDFTVFVRLHMLWPQAWVQMNFNFEDLVASDHSLLMSMSVLESYPRCYRLILFALY